MNVYFLLLKLDCPGNGMYTDPFECGHKRKNGSLVRLKRYPHSPITRLFDFVLENLSSLDLLIAKIHMSLKNYNSIFFTNFEPLKS